MSPPHLPLAQARLDFIPSDLSGVTWNAQTRTCFHVTNKSSGDAQCFETTREGRLLRAIAQQGFEDTEALVWLGGTRFAIAEERLQRITLCDITPETRILSREAPGHVSWTPLTDTPGNSGIEGMAFDPDRQCLYFCQEHPSGKDRIGPWYLYALHLQTGACTPLIDLRPRFTPSPQDPGVKDISELCFDPVTRSLLVLSHESDCVIRLAAPEKSSALESPHDWPIIDHVRGLGFKQAEGLCLAPTSVEPGSPLSVIISGEPAFWAQTPVWWK